MNAKSIVRLSYAICIVSVILLTFWVFTYTTMQIFGLKVFRENITQTFYLSIIGIITLMFGALITNIMFNLTRIAEKHNNDNCDIGKNSNILVILFIISFPLIIVLLFTGDYLTSKKKESMLIQSAESITTNNKNIIKEFGNYSFSKSWILNSENKLELLSNMDTNYRNISLILLDEIDGNPVFLNFRRNYYDKDKTPEMIDFIFKSDTEQREYMQRVFTGNDFKKKFSSSDGKYELFYPIKVENKILILFFQDQQRYGKIGS